MDNSMDRYIGTTLDKRYEILEIIGRGGMAVVYRAHDQLLKRFVAVKILRDDMAADREFRSNFQKEGQAVAKLSHPNIVSVYDVSREPGVDYIVMELIEGVTLKQYMKSKGQLDCKESIHFAIQVARALSHAHKRGIVHRDIKPQNIMIGMDGSAKVADFGIAYLETAQAAAESGTGIGSVHYISPEQAKGHPTDARSDIYSLGIVMYEMLTGYLPFTGETSEEIALQHVSATPVPLRELDPEIPQELEDITLKAMRSDITQRYQSAEALLEDLEKYRLSLMQGTSEEVDPAMLIPRDVDPIGRTGELSRESYARRRRRANKISLLSGFFLVIIFIAGLFVFLWNYWLGDIFAEPVRVNMPNFVGSLEEEVTGNAEYKGEYRFTVTEVIDPDTPAGTILSQSPEANKSVMRTGDPIRVELTVSLGMQMVSMPDVINMEYKDAVTTLQVDGFKPEVEFTVSTDVTANYVISTSPGPGDQAASGSRVYLTVSAGAVARQVEVPNLIGLTVEAAATRLETHNLVLGEVTPVAHEMAAGTVVGQSVEAGTQVDEHTKIFIQASTGQSEPAEAESGAGSGGITIPEEAPTVVSGR